MRSGCHNVALLPSATTSKRFPPWHRLTQPYSSSRLITASHLAASEDPLHPSSILAPPFQHAGSSGARVAFAEDPPLHRPLSPLVYHFLPLRIDVQGSPLSEKDQAGRSAPRLWSAEWLGRSKRRSRWWQCERRFPASFIFFHVGLLDGQDSPAIPLSRLAHSAAILLRLLLLVSALFPKDSSLLLCETEAVTSKGCCDGETEGSDGDAGDGECG